MTLRVDTDGQAFYLHEALGHTVPAMNQPWTLLGEMVINSNNGLGSILATRYLNSTPTGWNGAYIDFGGTTLKAYVNPGTGQVGSDGLTLSPGRYPISVHYDGVGLTQIKFDGVVVQERAGVMPVGTPGDRSLQFAGYASISGFIDSTWARWRFWSADLTGPECQAEHRSANAVRTADLISDWPMLPGVNRFQDIVGSNTFAENTPLPIGDGDEIELLDPLQTLHPASDVSAGPWTPSTGATLYGVLDESPANDTDYASASANGEMVLGFGSGDPPDSGEQRLTFRAAGSAAKKLTVTAYSGGTPIDSFEVANLTSAVREYIWQLSPAFSSLSNPRFGFDVQPATTPPTPLADFGAIGTSANVTSTTTTTAAYPAGTISPLTSKLLLVVTGRSNTAATAPAVTGGGWTLVGSIEGGVGTWGVDTGTRRVDFFVKDTVTGTETGNVTVTLAGTANNTLYARIIRIEVPSGYSLGTQFASGSDVTAGTGFSATGGNLTFAAGDLLVIGHAGSTDTATQSAQAITATGVTFGTRTNRASIAVTGGNDHRHVIDTVPVTTGNVTPAAPTYAYTASANTSGPVGFLLLRAVPPTVFARVTHAVLTTPTGEPAAGAVLKAWIGGAWVVGALKRRVGGAWVAAILKYRSGSDWL